ncbi:MAG: archaeal flagellar protein FlaI [Methanofollis sp.]|nr:archaeal flagellar protein FlaI [Methanofollis sp.]
MNKNTGSKKRLHDILIKINRTEEERPTNAPGQKHAAGGKNDFDALRSMIGKDDQLNINDLIRDARDMGPISTESPGGRDLPVPQHEERFPDDLKDKPDNLINSETSAGAPVIDPENLEALKSVVDALFGEEKTAETSRAEGGGTEQIPVLSDEVGEEEEAVPASAPVSRPHTTRWSTGAAGTPDNVTAEITDADDIDSLSELILPRAATFDVEELVLDFETGSHSTGLIGIPPEIDGIWSKNFPNIAEEARNVVIGREDAETGGLLEKFNIFTKLRHSVEEYNPRLHGPLVDLTFIPTPGIEEIELYPVNEPYAYVRIVYDNTSHEYTYEVLEPEMTGAETELLGEIKERLFERLDINTKEISRAEAQKVLRVYSDEIISDYGINLTPVSREKILYSIGRDFLGDGLIDAIMHDKYIEDISCDGLNNPIFIYHSGYESIQTNLMYTDHLELDSFVTKLAQRAGKYISIAEPMLDATMSDGSRIQMTLGREVTAHGSTFTIRKFKDEPISPTDLIEWGTFSPLSIAFLWLAVEAGNSAIFAGGTASGKTTSLNAISLFIPPQAKIVSLEDTRELKLPHPNWIPSVTRDSFDTGGKGEIDMYELLRAALRQRPEYIIVGEVRGKEAQTLFQAMSTGHVTYATIHADSVASVVHRLENPPLNVPRNMLTALNLVCVQVQARVGGQRIRRNKQIIEILDIDPRTNELITNEVFSWHQATDEIRYSGKSYVLESIMETRGWSEARMREELKRRQEILEWMRIKKIRHYRDVSKMLISYFRDPDAVMKIVRGDLYE